VEGGSDLDKAAITENQTLTGKSWGVFGRDLQDGKGAPERELSVFEYCLDASTSADGQKLHPTYAKIAKFENSGYEMKPGGDVLGRD